MYEKLSKIKFKIPFQAALSSLEREAKENVYAVLDPHIQYDITINRQGEPPKYLSLSKPLTHQRTHSFDPQTINEINNNTFSTFKAEPKIRRSNKSNNSKNRYNQSYISKTNNDVEYSRDPNFGMVRANAQTRHNERSSKNSRMYERNNSKRNTRNTEAETYASRRQEQKPYENRKTYEENPNGNRKANEENNKEDDYKPRPGKVKEIASRFNRNSVQNTRRERPKPVQSYGNQAYLDHVFPDAVEI